MAKREKAKERFRVIVRCKGYVAAYLVANFNRPDENWDEMINLSDDKPLHDIFLSMLKRGEERYDNRLKGTRYRYQVSIEITYDQFQRYGWLLTMTDTMKFNAILESRVKNILYSYVGMLRVTGLPLMECIRRFRERTHIEEWMWDTDSIRKDLQRHLPYDPTIMEDFLTNLEKNVWRTLTKTGTITEQGQKYYSNERTDI
jgi:hypothetical protein